MPSCGSWRNRRTRSCASTRKALRQTVCRSPYSDDALRAIARAALDRRAGARGLQAVLELVMQDVKFDAPSQGRRRVEMRVEDVEKALGPRMLRKSA